MSREGNEKANLHSEVKGEWWQARIRKKNLMLSEITVEETGE